MMERIKRMTQIIFNHEWHEFAFISKIRSIRFIVPKELVFINIQLRDDGKDRKETSPFGQIERMERKSLICLIDFVELRFVPIRLIIAQQYVFYNHEFAFSMKAFSGSCASTAWKN